MVSGAKSISETLNKGESHVEVRKTSKSRNQTVSLNKGTDEDKLETMTNESQLMREAYKDDIQHYNDSKAFKSKHFANQKKAQKATPKPSGGFLGFLGCCDGR